MTPASGGPPEYVPGSTQAAPPPGAYVPGSTQAAPPPTSGEWARASASLGTPGRQIGPYVVERELGRGGMGVVLVVRHPRIPRPLAMKVILSDADPEALQRFGQEAQVMARVRHPNVVVVHELGRAAEGPYLVSELVEGTGLDRRLREGPLEPRQAATLVRALADGLAACHMAGVVHRDLKPANVMLRADGSPVLLDFGIARDQKAERMTRTGQLMGTPAYMAPEQAEGDKALDSRVDVYGLAAILFECLCGRPPFSQHDPPMVVLKKVLLEEPVWPRATHPAVPRSLEELVRVAMAKSPDARHQGMVAFRADLDRWLRGQATWASTHAPRAPGGGRRVALGLCGLLLAAAGVGGWLAPRSAPAHEDAGDSVAGVASKARSEPAKVASAAPPPPPAWKGLAGARERTVGAWRAVREAKAQHRSDPDALAVVHTWHLKIQSPVDELTCRTRIDWDWIQGRSPDLPPACAARVVVTPDERVFLVRADGVVGMWRDLRSRLGKTSHDPTKYPRVHPDHEESLSETERPLGWWAPALWHDGALLVGDRSLIRLTFDGRPGTSVEGTRAPAGKVIHALLDVPGSGLLVGEGDVAENAGTGRVLLGGAELGTLRLGPARSAAVSSNRQWLVATGGTGGGGSSQSTLRVWHRPEGEGWRAWGEEVELTLGTFDALTFLPGGTRFVVGTWTNRLELRDARAPDAVLGEFQDENAVGVGFGQTAAHSAGIHATLVQGPRLWSGSSGLPQRDPKKKDPVGDVRSWPIPAESARGAYPHTDTRLLVPEGCYSMAFLGDDVLLVGDFQGRVNVYLVCPEP